MLYSPKSLISYAFALNSDFVYEEGGEASKLTKLQDYCEHLSSETQDENAFQVTEAIKCLRQCIRDLCGLNKTSELKKINSALDPVKFFSTVEYQVFSSLIPTHYSRSNLQKRWRLSRLSNRSLEPWNSSVASRYQ